MNIILTILGVIFALFVVTFLIYWFNLDMKLVIAVYDWLWKNRYDKMKKDKRFIKICSQGGMTSAEILVDKETGVNYLLRQSGYGGGLTVLLDKDGNPFVTSFMDLRGL